MRRATCGTNQSVSLRIGGPTIDREPQAFRTETTWPSERKHQPPEREHYPRRNNPPSEREQPDGELIKLPQARVLRPAVRDAQRPKRRQEHAQNHTAQRRQPFHRKSHRIFLSPLKYRRRLLRSIPPAPRSRARPLLSAIRSNPTIWGSRNDHFAVPDRTQPTATCCAGSTAIVRLGVFFCLRARRRRPHPPLEAVAPQEVHEVERREGQEEVLEHQQARERRPSRQNLALGVWGGRGRRGAGR